MYRKEADIGVACQSGRVFPLSEGVTGAVVARRGSVVFGDYARGARRPRARGRPGDAAGRDRRADLVADRASSAPASSSAATATAPSTTRTRRCSSCSPSTRRWPSPTRGCTSRPRPTRAPRRPPRSATAWRARCTTPWPRASSRCCCSCARPRPTWRRAAPASCGAPSTRPRAAARFALDETRRSVLGLAPSPARGPLAGGGPRARAGLGEPDRRGRRPPGGRRRAGAAARRGRPLALPHRPGGADQRAPPRRGPLGADRDRLRPARRHPARAGRRRGLRPGRGRAAPARCTASACAGWPSGPACWAARWRWSPRPAGARACAPRLPRAGRRRRRAPAAARVRLLIADDHEAIRDRHRAACWPTSSRRSRWSGHAGSGPRGAGAVARAAPGRRR